LKYSGMKCLPYVAYTSDIIKTTSYDTETKTSTAMWNVWNGVWK